MDPGKTLGKIGKVKMGEFFLNFYQHDCAHLKKKFWKRRPDQLDQLKKEEDRLWDQKVPALRQHTAPRGNSGWYLGLFNLVDISLLVPATAT